MSASGSTSIAANDLTLNASGCPANVFGLFYYGQGQVQVPLGDGFRCIGGNFVRLPVVLTDFVGQATYAIDFNNLPPAGQINPGESWDFQFWYRDGPGGPAGFNFSDAVEITVCE